MDETDRNAKITIEGMVESHYPLLPTVIKGDLSKMERADQVLQWILLASSIRIN